MARRRGTKVEQIQAPWWETHELVIIRTRVTHGDQKRMYQNLASARISAGTTEVQFQIAEVQGAMCKTMITDWTLTDEQGNRLKLTDEAIDDLAAEDIEFIAGEVGKRNPVLTPEERANFLAQQETTS